MFPAPRQPPLAPFPRQVLFECEYEGSPSDKWDCQESQKPALGRFSSVLVEQSAWSRQAAAASLSVLPLMFRQKSSQEPGHCQEQKRIHLLRMLGAFSSAPTPAQNLLYTFIQCIPHLISSLFRVDELHSWKLKNVPRVHRPQYQLTFSLWPGISIIVAFQPLPQPSDHGQRE